MSKIANNSIWTRARDGAMVKITDNSRASLLGFSYRDQYGFIVNAHSLMARAYLLRAYSPFMGCVQ
jgi:hypothetical protein